LNELDIQKQLIKDAKKLPGTFAKQMSSKLTGGFPDLLIKVPGYGAVYAEVKFVNNHAGKGSIKVNTTALQRKVMKDMVYAGFQVEVWVVVKYKDLDVYLYRVAPDVTSVPLQCRTEKKGRFGWDMRNIVNNPIKLY